MSDEHVMQVPPPEMAVIPEDQRLEKSPYKDILPEDVELYRKHMVHYFDNQMNRDILLLPQADKERLFQMLTDYADVLEKIFHPGINYDYDCPIIREYNEWVKAQQVASEPDQS